MCRLRTMLRIGGRTMRRRNRPHPSRRLLREDEGYGAIPDTVGLEHDEMKVDHIRPWRRVCAFGRRNGVEDRTDSVISGSLCGLAQPVFELGEELFAPTRM